MEVRIAGEAQDPIVLELSGRMDAAGVEKSEARFYALFAQRGKNTVFDLTSVSFLSSMGLRVLISGARTLRSRGGKVAVVAPAGPARDVLENAAMDQLMPVVESVEEARALLRAASA